MGLQIKDATEVFKNLVDWITAKTDKIRDFNVGSAIRTLLESIAIQFEEFYFDMKRNVDFAIENSIFNAFNFELEPASYATGEVTVYFNKPLPDSMTFPKGVIFSTTSAFGNIMFESINEQTALKGETEINISVQCKTIGEAGNVPTGAITELTTTNPIINYVTNNSDFTNGKNTETNQERKKRFQDYIKSLGRATRSSIIQGALEVEGVEGAYVDDSYIGYVKLYAHNSDGELPEELKTSIMTNMVNYRAGGIEVEILPVVKKEVDVKLTIIIEDDYDVYNYASLMKSLVTSTLNEYVVSKDLYVSDIIYQLKTVYDDLIVNIISDEFVDINIPDNAVIRAGNIDITCINVSNWRA